MGLMKEKSEAASPGNGKAARIDRFIKTGLKVTKEQPLKGKGLDKAVMSLVHMIRERSKIERTIEYETNLKNGVVKLQSVLPKKTRIAQSYTRFMRSAMVI